MSRFEQAKEIAVGATNYLKMKANIADAEIESLQRKRYDVCFSCEHRIRQTDTCGLCGCYLKMKTRSPESSCPAGHWQRIVINTNNRR